MKNSLIIVAFFTLGLFLGATKLITFPGENNFDYYVLAVLMFLVGVNSGLNKAVFDIIKKVRLKITLVPLSAIAGTWLGVALIPLIFPYFSLKDALAVGSGFGYYSLSSILIGELRSEELGVIALIANVSREIFTLLLTPLMVKFFGKITPIAVGGATSMDTTLPVITRYSGTDYAMISIFNGAVLTFLVPVFVSFFLSI